MGLKEKDYAMQLRHLIFAAALAATATQAHADGFTDTWIGVRDGTTISNPGAEKGGRDVNKVITNFGHFDAGAYGSNFVNLDILLSNPNEPAANSPGGSTEFYALYRGQFSPDKFLGMNTNIGPFKAINFEIGGDLEGENNAFGADKKAIVVGPNFHLDVPVGFVNVGVHAYHEWNHNGIVGKDVSFDTTAEFEIVWFFPLTFTNLPLDFKGFTNVVLPKGKDGFGAQTKTEVLARPQIDLDIGDLMFKKPHTLYAYFQVELWENKFGNDHTKVSGSEEVSPVLGIEYHF